MPHPDVPSYYANKVVFITGATGFVGKVVLERLLSSCPDVAAVYVLMRSKRGVPAEERIKTFLANPLFDMIRATSPSSLEKVRVIPGDVSEQELGLSNDDREELQSSCNVVFHSAACVRFDQKLKDAVAMNTVGTLRVLQLAETMKNLEVLVHLSTAYCRCELPALEERVYQSQHPPERVMELCRWMDDDLLDHLEPKMIGSEPNTYSYTKAMTEALVAEYAQKFPIAIARPSIITAIWKDPIPGWVDNLNGPTGLLIGAGKGVIRSMHCEPSYQIDAIPVDVVANGCLLIAYATALDKPQQARVYNITLSSQLKLTWGEIIELGKKQVNKYPFIVALWYPGGSIKSYRWTHQLCVVLTHTLPAYCVDLLLLLLGKKTFLVKLQERISHGLAILQHYTVKEWTFRNDNYRGLRDRISRADDETFYTNVADLEIEGYMRNYVLGCRKYCCKEEPETIPRARKIHMIRFAVHLITMAFFYFLLAWLLYTYSHIFTSCLGYLDSTMTSLSPFQSVRAEDGRQCLIS